LGGWGYKLPLPLKLPLLLTPLTYIHVGNPCPLPEGERESVYPLFLWERVRVRVL